MKELTVSNRIDSAYCEGMNSPGTKLLGHSNLLFNERVSKADSACSIYSKGEHCRVAITDCINYWRLICCDSEGFYSSERCIEEVDNEQEFFEWLEENLFCLSSYAFLKGNTDRYYFPKTLLAYLKHKVLTFKELLPKDQRASDFLIRRDPYACRLDKARLNIRDLEQEYVRWWQDPRVVTDFYTHLWCDPKTGLVRFRNMIVNYHILNTLSTYFFWLARYYVYAVSPEKCTDKEWSCTPSVHSFTLTSPELEPTDFDMFLSKITSVCTPSWWESL